MPAGPTGTLTCRFHWPGDAELFAVGDGVTVTVEVGPGTGTTTVVVGPGTGTTSVVDVVVSVEGYVFSCLQPASARIARQLKTDNLEMLRMLSLDLRRRIGPSVKIASYLMVPNRRSPR